MNKHFWLPVFTVFVVVSVLACSGKKGEQAHAATDPDHWKEMDDFHMIMAESFHPYKDSANLEPAKIHADAMARSAEQWSKAPLPEKVNNDHVKEMLDLLAVGTAEFAETVKSDDEAEIAQSLNDLHDLFHTLQEEWYGGHGHDHDHHSH